MRLTLLQVIVLGLVLVAFASLVYAVVAQELEKRLAYTVYLSGLEAKGALKDVTLAPPGAIDPFALPASPDYANLTLYVQYVSVDGQVLEMSPNLEHPLPVSPQTIQQVLGEGKTDVHQSLKLPGEWIEVYSARWTPPGAAAGTPAGVLQIAAAEPTIAGDLQRIGLILAGVVLVATAAAAWIGWTVIGKALRPVDELARSAREIGAAADFSRRLPELPERDEIGRLAATFNTMLADLDHAFTTQRRFLADAAHELRTPLAVIRANAETWLRSERQAEQTSAARTVAREADRLGRLVTDLLILARGDVGQPLIRRSIALDTLLLDVYRQQLLLAEGVNLVLGDFDQVTVAGDPDRLRQLVLNLVDNALRFTPAGGTVTLDVTREDAWAILRVRDTGPGIPAEHLPRIFDRFHRVDEARARDTGGSGLGLAISQEIAHAHGGRIEVTSEEGHGTTFTVLLPVSREEPPNTAATEPGAPSPGTDGS